MSRFFWPEHHKFQRRPWYKNTGPVFRYMKSMTIRYYPFAPTAVHVSELYRKINTRQQLEHTEKGFKLEQKFENFGYRSTVEAVYRNGEKLTLCGETHNAEDLLKLLMYKRLDLEEQWNWVESKTMLTLEEEAAMFAAKEKKKKDKGKKVKLAPNLQQQQLAVNLPWVELQKRKNSHVFSIYFDYLFMHRFSGFLDFSCRINCS